MSDRTFADSNVLIYAVEIGGEETDKAAIARALIERTRPCLSTQVLGEFYNAVTSARRRDPMTHEEAVEWIAKWLRLEVRPVTTAHVELALDLRKRFQVSYYDALILAAARLAECPAVYSEDLNNGQNYGGVTAINPFAPLQQNRP
ncbi:twitching motility protein PilT [Verrucomicrobiota bacterium]|nr:twitching motility protein PilT [Verrucomicrobiota bacterium]